MPNSLLSLVQLLQEATIFRLPRVVAFNRLEPRPRTSDFTRSLRAEVRDPLWMLTRQWQFGEFQGEDAASPVTARIAYRHHEIEHVKLSGESSAYDAGDMPLETFVEREPIPLVLRESSGAIHSDILFALRWGREFLARLRTAGLDSHHSVYLQRFPIRVAPGEAKIDVEAEHICVAAAGRVVDGVALWRSVQEGAHDPWLDSRPGGDKPVLKLIAADFAQSCSDSIRRMFAQPPDESTQAWQPERLEYRFAVAAPPAADSSSPILVADQYSGGRLDWHSFDLATSPPQSNDPEENEEEEESAAPQQLVESFLPAPVRFKGQPQPRFWQMEESQTDFGKVETSATGLLHLMLAEFGLIYSNDWFMLPHPMEMNLVCEVNGIMVDDTFGRHTFVRPAGRGPETAWQQFAMFRQTDRDGLNEANLFYLVPSVGHLLESPPLERVNFVRDEMANMAWGVESIVPSQMGLGMSGDAGSRPPAPPPPEAESEEVKIAYRAGTRAPRNWIPFIPVHADEQMSEIRLQRARMAGGEPPRGRLLREPGSPYFIEEEEIVRAGVYVDRSWQRARWIGGRTLTWVGRRKTAGRGGGSSGLVFDRIVDLKPKS